MTLKVFTTALSFFLIVFILHIFLWRLLKPRRHMRAVFLHFLLLPALFWVGIYFAAFEDFFSWACACLLYFSLAAAYVQTYPAFQAISPSLKIVYFIGSSPDGMSIADIEKLFPREALIEDRFKDLVAEGFVKISPEGSIIFLSKGQALAQPFVMFRKFLGLAEGKG